MSIMLEKVEGKNNKVDGLYYKSDRYTFFWRSDKYVRVYSLSRKQEEFSV